MYMDVIVYSCLKFNTSPAYLGTAVSAGTSSMMVRYVVNPSIHWGLVMDKCLNNMMTSSNGNISALPAICAGNSPVPGEFPAQRLVTRSLDVSFDLRLNKRLKKVYCFKRLWSERNDWNFLHLFINDETRPSWRYHLSYKQKCHFMGHETVFFNSNSREKEHGWGRRLPCSRCHLASWPVKQSTYVTTFRRFAKVDEIGIQTNPEKGSLFHWPTCSTTLEVRATD